MALVFTTNTYAGEGASEYISQALLGASTLDRDLVTILPNVKKRQVIRLIEQDVVIQAEKCNFNPLGNTTFNERYLDPVGMQVNYELCIKDLRTSWEAAKLRAGRNNETIPDDLGTFLIEETIRKIKIAVDKLFWNGKAAGATTVGSSEVTFEAALVYSGLLTELAADAAVIDVDLEAITAANVVTELSKIYEAILESVRYSDELVMLVSPNVASAYRLAQATVSTGQGAYFTGSRDINFLGMNMEIVNHLPANTVLVYRRSNVYFGTDLLSDFNEVRTVDMRNTTADKKVRFSADFAFDGNYAYGGEIVYGRVIA